MVMKMMKYERFTWKAEKLQHLDDEVIMVVDNANKEWKGHILNIVDMLNELNDERMMYKTTIDKRIAELEKENDDFRKSIKEYEDLRKRLNKDKSRLIEEKMSLNAFVIEKGLIEEYMRWENE